MDLKIEGFPEYQEGKVTFTFDPKENLGIEVDEAKAEIERRITEAGMTPRGWAQDATGKYRIIGSLSAIGHPPRTGSDPEEIVASTREALDAAIKIVKAGGNPDGTVIIQITLSSDLVPALTHLLGSLASQLGITGPPQGANPLVWQVRLSRSAVGKLLNIGKNFKRP